MKVEGYFVHMLSVAFNMVGYDDGVVLLLNS